MKNLLLILLLSVVCSVKSQGLTIGLGTGTSLARIEAGYSVNENNHLVATIGPGISDIYASEYGVLFRRTFEDNDLGFGYWSASFRGYVGAGIGIIKTPSKTEGVFDLWNGTYTEETIPGKSLLGYNAHAGAEILYGSSGKFGSFIEIQAGRVPSFLNFISDKQTAAIGFVGGIRFYFGN